MYNARDSINKWTFLNRRPLVSAVLVWGHETQRKAVVCL
jgi:hypothetical protein